MVGKPTPVDVEALHILRLIQTRNFGQEVIFGPVDRNLAIVAYQDVAFLVKEVDSVHGLWELDLSNELLFSIEYLHKTVF